MRGVADEELRRRFRAARRDPELTVLEGFHALKHALRFGAEVERRWRPTPRSSRGSPPTWRRTWRGASPRWSRPIDADELAGLVPQAPRTGVVAIARRKPADLGAALADPREAPVVLLEQPRNMGNLGACVRVAAAADAAALLTIGENDPWHPDAVRGAAGLHYALPAVAAVERAPSGVGTAAAGARPGGGGDRPGGDRRRAPSSPSAPSATGSATSCSPPPTAASRCRCARASPASTSPPRSRRSFTHRSCTSAPYR